MNPLRKIGLVIGAIAFCLSLSAAMGFAQPGKARWSGNTGKHRGWTKELTFRPPFGKKLFTLPYYLSQNERKSITWDVEPESFVENTDDIIRYTLENTENGSIILLHVMYDSRSESRKAVKPIIEKLRARGFEFVTVSELLAMKN